jgi:alkylation response protein AidB-like acyl-CoA dehydrogenase
MNFDKIDAFLHEHIVPLEPLLLTGRTSELEEQLVVLRHRVKQAGWWLPQLATEHGGAGLDLVAFGRLSEVLGQSPLAHYVFGCQAPDAGNIELLIEAGTKEQKQRYLAPLIAGQMRSCFAMTEPDTSGANPTELACQARRDGDEWVISGRKWFATAADGSSFAIVMAVTDPEATPHQRASMLLVPMHAEGLTLVRNVPVMGHAGGGYFSHGELNFDQVRVPLDALLGEQGGGFKLAQARLGPGRIHHCMRWLGICKRALDLACQRAVSRPVGRGQTLADKELVQAMLADAAAEMAAARALVLEVADEAQRHGFSNARARVGMIKYFSAGVLQRVVDAALQVHGALGVTDDTILAFFYREERAARIYDGPDEVHRLSVARQLLKPYRQGK